MFMSKDDSEQNGLALPPPIEQQAGGVTGADSVPVTSVAVGSATHLNAFYEDLNDEIAKAHNAINEIADKAKAYVAKFQSGQ